MTRIQVRDITWRTLKLHGKLIGIAGVGNFKRAAVEVDADL